jgi:hypothetical protein
MSIWRARDSEQVLLMVRNPVAKILFVLCLLGCLGCNGDEWQPCAKPADCHQDQECVWLNLGDDSGYHCATRCGEDNDCPDGESCGSTTASSCNVCMDIFHVCE